MSKLQRQGFHFSSLPTSDYNHHHFLPTLSHVKSSSSISQRIDASPLVTPAKQEKNTTPHEINKSQNGEVTEPKEIPKSSQQPNPLFQPDDISDPVMVNSVISDKKRDRKSQARRHLVEGLSSNHQRYNDPNRRSLYRSQTFINSHDVTTATKRPQRAMRHSPKSKDDGGIQKDKLCPPGHRDGGVSNSKVVLNDRARAAIENWNELIMELNSHQYVNNSKNNHLSVLSDTSSSDDFSPFPLSSKTQHRSFYQPKNSFLSTSDTFSSQSVVKTNKFTGLGFTRYRPITPNLLLKLDKLKLSSRKKTQRWINQLEDQRRSYNVAARVTQENDESVNLTGNAEENSTIDQSGTPDVNNLKALKRTESYDSSRIRQSSFVHVNKSKSEFL